jgi:hypothetical protein
MKSKHVPITTGLVAMVTVLALVTQYVGRRRRSVHAS